MKKPIPLYKPPPAGLTAGELSRWLTQRAHDTSSVHERNLCISMIDDLALIVKSYQAGEALASTTGGSY